MYSYKKMWKRLAVTTAGLVLTFGVSVQAAEPREDGAHQKTTPVTAVQETMQTTSAETVDPGEEPTEQAAISMEHLTDPLGAEETVRFHAREIEEEAVRARQEQAAQERAAAGQQKVTLTPEEQAEDVTYARRLACCGKCTWYGEHMCRACGCYVQLRAAVKGQNCPYEKWEQEGETHDTRSGNIL